MDLRKGFLIFVCCLVLSSGVVSGWAQERPEPDPPYVENPTDKPLRGIRLGVTRAPSTEWVYHKTADGGHPDGNEQHMLWLLNRARPNPVQEGVYLANTGNAEVVSAITYFSVDLGVMQSEFTAITPKGPAAFDKRLYQAAYEHSLDLISRDAQDHTGQLDLVTASGFPWSAYGGNVFSYADGAVYAHAGFNIDWGGNDGTGMQTGRGHRRNKMSSAGELFNVGIAVVPVLDSGKSVGPLVITENYCKASLTTSSFNVFIVGTVWTDSNSNGEYDSGEGIGGVTVTPDAGTYYAITGDAGGYAIPVDAGSYQVTFSGAGLAQADFSVTVGSQSALLDYKDPASAQTVESNILPALLTILLED